ncbi:protein of unknown function [Ruminococcaceae bacterium BL-4]|nr:protein of unknown function [Ruminococcaceae bacterium BL-4]
MPKQKKSIYSNESLKYPITNGKSRRMGILLFSKAKQFPQS